MIWHIAEQLTHGKEVKADLSTDMDILATYFHHWRLLPREPNNLTISFTKRSLSTMYPLALALCPACYRTLLELIGGTTSKKSVLAHSWDERWNKEDTRPHCQAAPPPRPLALT